MALNDYTSCGSVSLASIDARCDTSFGGVKRVLVGLKDNVTITIDPELKAASGSATAILNDDELITAITNATNTAFVEFKFRRNTASLTSTVAPDVAIGNSFSTNVLTLQFSKAEAKKRIILQSLINAGAVLIVEDMYGNYQFLGKDREVNVTNATSVTGTQQTDLNGYTIELTDVSLELPHFINTDSANSDTGKFVNITSLLTPANNTSGGAQ